MLHGVGMLGRVMAAMSNPSAPSLDLSFMSPGSLDPRVTFARASSGGYVDISGTMQTATSNTPRWDYDPVTHVLKGLLLEEARTNILLNSATLGTQSVTVTAQPYVLSFYGTGTITLSGVSTAGPLTGTGAARVTLNFTPTAGTLILTVSGSVLNAQLEGGNDFVTSYIATAGASATRAADVCTISAANMAGWFVGPGGTWFGEFINLDTTPVTGRRVIGRITSAGSVAPIIINPTLLLTQFDGVTLNTANVSTPGVVTKGATTWTAGNAKACLNAGAVASAATLVTGYNGLATFGVFFLVNTTTASESMSGYLRHVSYWPRVLADAEMQAVTT